MDDWEELSFGVWILCARQVLEAVGRKDLPRTASVGSSVAGGDSGREIATSASHPGVAQSPRGLPEARRGPLLVIHPNDFLPSSPCDPGPPGGRRAHLEFPLSDGLVLVVDAHGGGAVARR